MRKDVRILALGVIIRILPVFFPQIQQIVLSCVESLTPLTSWLTLAEHVYYLKAGVPLYYGGADQIPPLLVLVLLVIMRFVPLAVVITALEVFSALRIVSLGRWCDGRPSILDSGSKINPVSSSWILVFYMFNPFLLVASLLGSILPILLFFITEAIYQALVKLRIDRLAIFLAMASYISLRSSLLIVPILALYYANNMSSVRNCVMGIVAFVGTSIALVFASSIQTKSFAFIRSCYILVLTFDKILPNVGLWWYLFIEMFEFFTPFYCVLFNVFSVLPILPITARLFQYSDNQGDGLTAFILCLQWLAFTHPYPSAGDFGYVLALLPVLKNSVLSRCLYIGATSIAILVAAVLLPIFYYCWIVLGTGNSNFFYSLNLTWALAQAALMVDVAWAQMVFDYERQYKIKGVRLRQI